MNEEEALTTIGRYSVGVKFQSEIDGCVVFRRRRVVPFSGVIMLIAGGNIRFRSVVVSAWEQLVLSHDLPFPFRRHYLKKQQRGFNELF